MNEQNVLRGLTKSVAMGEVTTWPNSNARKKLEFCRHRRKRVVTGEFYCISKSRFFLEKNIRQNWRFLKIHSFKGETARWVKQH